MNLAKHISPKILQNLKEIAVSSISTAEDINDTTYVIVDYRVGNVPDTLLPSLRSKRFCAVREQRITGRYFCSRSRPIFRAGKTPKTPFFALCATETLPMQASCSPMVLRRYVFIRRNALNDRSAEHRDVTDITARICTTLENSGNIANRSFSCIAP